MILNQYFRNHRLSLEKPLGVLVDASIPYALECFIEVLL